MDVVEGMKAASMVEQKEYDERAQIRREIKDLMMVRKTLRDMCGLTK